MKFHLSVCLNKSDISKHEINDNDEPINLEYEINRSFVIGRDKSCFVQILNSIVSSEHCTLVLMPTTKHDLNEYYAIRDGVFTGNVSRNGTWVNGDRIIISARLKHMDEITFGARYPKVIFTALADLDEIEVEIEKGTGAIDRDSLDLVEELSDETE